MMTDAPRRLLWAPEAESMRSQYQGSVQVSTSHIDVDALLALLVASKGGIED